MKKISKINCAEGIFLPCFDMTLNDMNEFETVDCKIQQMWDSVYMESKNNKFSLIWNGDVVLDGYDTILMFLNLPPYINVDLTATADDKEICVFSGISGGSAPVEAKGKIYNGAHITKLRIDFSCNNNDYNKHYITLYWIGASNSKDEHLIEEALPKYSEESWKEYLNYNAVPEFKNNILFSQDEMKYIKKQAQEGKYNHFKEAFSKKADEICEGAEPEKEIREYLPTGPHMYRFVRERDRDRKELGNLLMLAILGYLYDNPNWSYMAARKILCAVKTPNWFEGPQCCMEDSTWHHVCFMEESTTGNIAMAMGFLHGIFTDKAIKEIIAAMEKHYKTVIKCCREEGYRRYSNQGIVGNVGRMIGACGFYALGKKEYISEIEQCYKDHTEMLNDYINEEHHCVEGGGYFQYSIGESVKFWKAYSLFKGKSLSEVLPDSVVNSTYYINAILSSVSPKGKVVPLNNTHGGFFSEKILNILVDINDWDYGKYYLKNRISDTNENTSDIIDFLLVLNNASSKDIKATKPILPRSFIFEKSGFGAYEFDNGKFWFCCERNPRTGHFHADRGSVILEYGGEKLLADPGVTNYGNSLAGYMKKEDYHNVAHPDGIPMIVQSKIAQIAADEAGIGCRTKVKLADFEHPSPKIQYIRDIENGIEFCADVAELFGSEVLKANRSGSFYTVDNGCIISLADTWDFQNEKNLWVNFMSYAPWDISGKTATVSLNGIHMSLVFDANCDFSLISDENMSDFDMNQMYRLRLSTVSGTHFEIKCTAKICK